MKIGFKKLNVLVLDNHKIFVDGLCVALSEISLIGNIHRVETGSMAFDVLIGDYAIDIVFVDCYLQEMKATAFVNEVKEKFRNVKIIALSYFDIKDNIIAMLSSGADGYLLKSTDKIEIELALKSIMKGKHYFSKDIATEILDKIMIDAETGYNKNIKKFNNREREILDLIYAEFSSKEIAGKLFVSQKTVEFHRQNLIKKTGSSNIIGVIKYAIINKLF